MNRSVALGAVALIALATPALSQGRFGRESAEKAAARAENEAIRQAEHPGQNQPVAPAQPTPPEAPAEPAPAAEPATVPAQ